MFINLREQPARGVEFALGTHHVPPQAMPPASFIVHVGAQHQMAVGDRLLLCEQGAIRRNDLAAVPACKEATHYVYAYNLGAFALGSQRSIKGDVGAGGGQGRTNAAG